MQKLSQFSYCYVSESGGADNPAQNVADFPGADFPALRGRIIRPQNGFLAKDFGGCRAEAPRTIWADYLVKRGRIIRPKVSCNGSFRVGAYKSPLSSPKGQELP